MKMITKLFITLALTMLSNAVFATIYEQTNANGTITYSDIPLNATAKQIDISHENKITSAIPPTTPVTKNINPASSPLITSANKPYTQFEIVSPKDQATLQNQVTIPVTLAIKPDLQPGDKIQIYLDGKAKGTASTGTQFQLNEVDRGTHQLSATIINSNQQIIKQTNTITIYNHRASVNSIKATKANMGGLQ